MLRLCRVFSVGFGGASGREVGRSAFCTFWPVLSLLICLQRRAASMTVGSRADDCGCKGSVKIEENSETTTFVDSRRIRMTKS